MPRTNVIAEYTKLAGGLDMESPALSISPGALMRGMNYVCNPEGGYERIDGYERYSGKPSPSDAVYYRASCTFTGGGPAAGNTITGVSSGSTGVVITVGADYINYTKRSAPFTATETFNVSGSPKGAFSELGAESGEPTSLLHATALNLAADQYRADIAKPAGAYAIRGLALLAGVLYAFVDDATGTYGEIYKATTSGWSKITLCSQISFTTGTAAISEGNTITQLVSGATALVKRVVVESGTWAGGNAAGRLIINTITGTFNATNKLQVSSADKATASSLATAISILPGGRYETIVSNFTGSTSTKRIYGCDGVNKGFEFDGAIYVPINTGMTVDTPLHVSAIKQQLCFSFYGSSQNSTLGDPYQWSAVSGAGEIALGDYITGYSLEAKTLLILARNSMYQLFGDNSETFSLDSLDADVGAIPYTIQSIGRTYCLDDRGIIQVTRAQEYGNFNLAGISGRVQKAIDALRSYVSCSTVYRAKDQYRVYGSNGNGLCMAVGAGQNGLEYYFSEFKYPVYPSCAVSGEDATGKDVIFFGSSTGMVYQADKGSSFDGEEIEAYIWLPFNHSKSPTTLKTYRKATIEMTATGYTALRFGIEFSYGADDVQSHPTETKEVYGTGGFWDLSNWDEFYYDTRLVDAPAISIAGDGTNMSMVIYTKSEIDLGHKLDGVIIQYTPRRIVR